MKLDNIFRITPVSYMKLGSTVERTTVAFSVSLNARLLHVKTGAPAPVAACFFVKFYDINGKLVEEQIVEWYEVIAAYKLNGLSAEASVLALNNLVASFISGSTEEKLAAVDQYAAMNGLSVLPIIEQVPFFYEPLQYGEPGYVDPNPDAPVIS